MTLTSIYFLVFIIVVFSLYWTVCKRNKFLQNALLVLSSAFFYGWWDCRFLGLLYITVISTFFAAYWIEKLDSSKKKRKLVFIASLVLNLGILFAFKYYNFFVQSFVDVALALGFKVNTSTVHLLLPVGISFYTFSALSYCIDVYQRKISFTKDFLAYSAYVTFFPSILSGPINRAQKQLPQYFERRAFDYKTVSNACKLIIWGG